MEESRGPSPRTAQESGATPQQRQADPAGATTLLGPEEAFSRMEEDRADELRAYVLGVQAVIWGMQWVKAGGGLRSVADPLPAGTERSPVDPQPHGINVWGHARAMLTDRMRLIETPNTETLYSMAVVDLADGPVVVVHPDLGERYFRTSVWELHGDTHTISQKQDGGHPAPYPLVPLGWQGDLPAGLKSIRVRSRYVVIAPHIAVYGEDDVQNVTALQDGLLLLALRNWGKPDRPLESGPPMRPPHRPDTSTPPELRFFEELCENLKDVAIRDDEAAFARQLEGVGITLAAGFQFDDLEPATVAGLTRALPDAQSLLEHRARQIAPVQPGGTWQVGLDMTSLDTWLLRGAVGWKHVWGDLSSEIIFPMARTDAENNPLTGAHDYVMRFPPGELPPARYWRITMYDLAGFLVGNPIDRFGIGNMAEVLDPDADGGLTLLIRHDSPGAERETNWLPAPAQGFFLVMRMYQPEERMYRGQYTVPPVTRTN
jgi:hypothetical protein